MPGNPIKFRCYRCNRLLGVAAHKAGTVVSCPKCAAELLVPTSDAAEPDVDPAQALRGLVVSEPGAGDEAARAGSDALPNFPVSFDPPGPGPGPAAGAAPAFPATETEPITLRSAPAPAPARSEPLAPPGPTGGFPLIQTEPEPLRSEPAARRPRRARSEPAPEPPPPGIGPAPGPWPSPDPGATPAAPIVPAIRFEPEPRPLEPIPAPPAIPPAAVIPALVAPLPVVPPLAVEPSTSLTERGPTARRNDVVIPRSAVLLWSFTMLLALVAAFAAGLLAGHFLWNSPPARPVPGPVAPPGP